MEFMRKMSFLLIVTNPIVQRCIFLTNPIIYTIFFSIVFGNHFYEIFQIDFITSFIPLRKAITVAPTMGIPYGLNKNPNTNASIPSDISFCINDPIAATIHISIKKYRIVVPMPSRNVRNTVRILNSNLIGNKIIFIIHLIISYSSLPNSYFVSPHTISMQTFTSI